MVVLIIMMAFVGLSFPVIKGVHQKGKMNAAARELAITARLARQEAILRGQTVELHIDFQRDRYWIDLAPGFDRDGVYTSREEDRESIEEVHTVEDKLGGLYIQSVQSATDPFGSEQLVRIKFFKDGSATPSTVLLADGKPRYMTIEIAGATGNVRAHKGPPKHWDEFARKKRGRQ